MPTPDNRCAAIKVDGPHVWTCDRPAGHSGDHMDNCPGESYHMEWPNPRA